MGELAELTGFGEAGAVGASARAQALSFSLVVQRPAEGVLMK